jgi:hypothetical protein
VRVDCVLNGVASFGESPRVGLAFGVALTAVLDQPAASEPTEQLGDLALVRDTSGVADLTVAGFWVGADRGEHARGTERNTDWKVLEGVTRMLRPLAIAGDLGLRSAAVELTA